MFQRLRILLLPFSFIYGLVVFLRNKCYDWGFFRSKKFDLPVICVGNLAVGGSGKTPTVEYLVKLLSSSNKKIAILSRGYGRRTKGFLLADGYATAETIGDEPAQYHQKFKQVTVAVCENRFYGIEQLKHDHDVIILDDAFQHRAVKAGLNILLFEYEKILRWQWLLPAGNLRESLAGTRRADLVLITKSPPIITEEKRRHVKRKLDCLDKTLSFSSIRYENPVHIFEHTPLPNWSGFSLILLTGIANPSPLLVYLQSATVLVKHFDFPDHYQFSKTDLERLVDAYHEIDADKKIILTTEKDSQRLWRDDFRDLLLNLPIYYLPIAFEINADDRNQFEEKILKYVTNA